MANPFAKKVVWTTNYPAQAKGPGVLKGGTLVYVPHGNPDRSNAFYVVYAMPPGQNQHFVSYKFTDFNQVKATFGGDPNNYIAYEWTAKQVTDLAPAVADISEVVGMTGDWGTLSSSIMRKAAEAAGIRDPSLVGKIWSDPEMQRIAAEAVVGNWTEAQVVAEQRKTKFWQNTLYPGIKAFYGRATDPEKAWADYNASVSPALTMLGKPKDADGSYNSQIKKMLDLGIDADIFLENVPVFQQAVQNTEFFDILRQRSQAELGKDVTFGDWFGLLKGEAAPEIAKVAEGAVLAYQAQQADLSLQENMLQRLIAERDLTEAEGRNLFSEVNQAVLALGEDGLLRGELSRDDIISAAAGINPTSGLSVDEVKLKVAKLARENDLFDNEKINFYVGYDTAGRPNRPGLASLAPEGA